MDKSVLELINGPKFWWNRNKYTAYAIGAGSWVGAMIALFGFPFYVWEFWVVMLPVMLALGVLAGKLNFYRHWCQSLYAEQHDLMWTIRDYKRKGHDKFMQDLVAAASVTPPEVTKH